jgi:hypothetical protein
MFLYGENIFKHVLKCAVLGSATLVSCEWGWGDEGQLHTQCAIWKARLKFWNSQNPHKPITLQVGNIVKIIILLYGWCWKKNRQARNFFKKTINKHVSWKWWIQHSGNIGGWCLGGKKKKIGKQRISRKRQTKIIYSYIKRPLLANKGKGDTKHVY